MRTGHNLHKPEEFDALIEQMFECSPDATDTIKDTIKELGQKIYQMGFEDGQEYIQWARAGFPGAKWESKQN